MITEPAVTTETMAKPVPRIQKFLSELKRRSVFKVASVYAVTAWGASIGAAELLPAFGAPDWSVRVFVLIAVLGLPIAVVVAWAYEITPQGIVRDDVGDKLPAQTLFSGGSGRTTVMHGSQGTVRVSWQDAAGTHERVFNKNFRIGRDETCELYLDDPLISRRHAEVSHSEGVWWIADLGSRNGTLLDQQLVTRAHLPAVSGVKLYETGPVLRIEVKTPSSARMIMSPQQGSLPG
jgi:hypothetical protein